MSDEAQAQGNPQAGGWEPIPQSEGYDGDATAFVQLPPDFMLAGVPLEAPGHGYVPPVIAPLTPHVPEAGAAWAPEETPTASWTIPTIEDGAEALEDSGEYTASRLARYTGDAPATLPGGAPAPWAVQEPEPAPEAASEAVREPEAEPVPVQEFVEPAPQPVQEAPAPAPEPVREAPEPEPEPVAMPEPVPADFALDSTVDSDEHPHISYVLRVNGADRPVTESWIGESLLYVLRERLGLAGAKDGCSQGECGACNVQVDGRLVASCLVPAATAAGSEVRTVEGLAVDGEPSDVQQALAKCGVQCGFCIPGMAMTVHDLLEGNHAPTELETRQALCGNLCRCSGYRGVLDAVREVVTARGEAAEGEGPEPSLFGDDAEAARIPHQIPHQVPHPYDGGIA
ncbi:2Fe-2S iron-sulfur cluster-binding protein [Streptomyces sp. NPDC004327]|uniref:(2Fe-2S)-binding protein n=1 Tax=Streptomyces sp. NPDC004327 TaxID=3364699 RepID=UPI0036B0939F